MTSTPRTPRDGRRVLLHVAVVIALLGGLLAGLVARVAATFTIWGPVVPAAYREGAIASAVVAGLFALLGGFVVWGLRTPTLWPLVVLGTIAILAVAADASSAADTAPADPNGYHLTVDAGNVLASLGSAALLTGWPLLVLALAAAVHVRARSNRARRAPRDRSSAPAGPR